MEYRELGKTGLRVSALGFGCGNVGGLMIRGTAAERERAIARAVELGINYFDTAPSYGDGQSEQNLGAALRSRRARSTSARSSVWTLRTCVTCVAPSAARSTPA